MNDTVKWILIAIAGYLLYEQFSQGDLASTVGSTTTPTTSTGTTTTATTTSTSTGATTPATIPTPQVALISAVSATTNNALQATFSINGVQETIAVIPGGDAYNTSGQDITSALAAVGVTPAQLYALLSGAYNATKSGASAGTSPYQDTTITGRGSTLPTHGVRGINALAAGPAVHMRQTHGGKWVM